MQPIDPVQGDSAVPASSRGTPPWWLIWLVFLPFGAPMIAALLQAHPSALRLVASLAGAALFLGIYAWTAWQNGRELASPTPLTPPSEALAWLPLALMAILAVLLAVADGPVWGGLFIFTTAAAAGRLPLRKALLAIGALALVIALGGWRAQMSSADIVQALITAGVTAAATLTVVQSVRINRKLRIEREEMARFAGVAAERLRIARDLHDLLGHSLSLIALKSELAGRLVEVAPQQAAAEIRDIEQVARTALQEVREAVAGYRQPTLADELRDARDILAAAGISYRFEDDALASWHFPPAIEPVLAWALREGITNVIRHSRARSCRVSLSADGATAQLEIRDDGTAPTSMQTPTFRAGSGLRGIAERVVALGGTCEAGSLADGGFRLAVSLPLGGGQPSASAGLVPSPTSTAAAIATQGAPSAGDATH